MLNCLLLLIAWFVLLFVRIAPNFVPYSTFLAFKSLDLGLGRAGVKDIQYLMRLRKIILSLHVADF